MGNCLGRRKSSTHQRMTDVDSCYEATSLDEPRRSRFLPKWLQRRPKFTIRQRNNPYANIGQDDMIEREIYNPVVDGRELWPHETPDVWAVPAEEDAAIPRPPTHHTNNNNNNNNLNPTATLPTNKQRLTTPTTTAANRQLPHQPRQPRVHSDSHSSIELEWENEEGMPSNRALNSSSEDVLGSLGPQHARSSLLADGHPDRLSIGSGVTGATGPGGGRSSSRRSSLSLQNELEWDEDYASPDAFEGLRVDFDTEQLIAEIDQMTEKALRETEREDTSLPPFNSLDSMHSL